MRRYLLAVLSIAILAMVVAGVGSAGREQQTFSCGGLGTITFTVTSTNNDHSVAWGVGTIAPGQHLIPVAFNFSATDLRTGEVVFSDGQTKGGGNGMHNQQTLACSSPAETVTAGDAGIAGPNVLPTDTISFQFSATVVYKG